jgi:5'(3')-deoxyribonucleotidase
MINPRAVAFDFDGVVADTMSLFIEVARDVHQIDSLTYDGFTCYNLIECTALDEETLIDIVDRIQDGRYGDLLAPIMGAADVLQRLGDQYGPLVFITARPHAKPVDDWLHRVLSLDPEMIEVVPTGSYDAKADELTRRRISFFIEDRLETCFQIQEVGVVPVLFKQPWNRETHPFKEVGNWRELDSLIQW